MMSNTIDFFEGHSGEPSATVSFGDRRVHFRTKTCCPEGHGHVRLHVLKEPQRPGQDLTNALEEGLVDFLEGFVQLDFKNVRSLDVTIGVLQDLRKRMAEDAEVAELARCC